jgi:hypothetical protein
MFATVHTVTGVGCATCSCGLLQAVMESIAMTAAQIELRTLGAFMVISPNYDEVHSPISSQINLRDQYNK